MMPHFCKAEKNETFLRGCAVVRSFVLCIVDKSGIRFMSSESWTFFLFSQLAFPTTLQRDTKL